MAKTKTPPKKNSERWLVAIHEAGHFVVGLAFEYPMAEVNIHATPEQEGIAWVRGLRLSTRSLNERLNYIAFSLAGYEAERRHTRCSIAASFIAYNMTSDWCAARETASSAHSWAEGEQLNTLVNDDLEEGRLIASKMLARHWAAVEAVAQGLIEKQELTGEEAKSLAHSAPDHRLRLVGLDAE